MFASIPAPALRPGVLIVDNDPYLHGICDRALSLCGFDRIEAHDSRRAFEEAIAKRPSLAIVDLSLPAHDGVALIKRLKEDPRTAAIPVLAIAGRDTADDGVPTERAGADSMLWKPLTPADITSTVQILIERAAWFALFRTGIGRQSPP